MGIIISKADVPSAAFQENIVDREDSDPVKQLYFNLFDSPAFLGGLPLWLQGDKFQGDFLMQLSQSLLGVNFGDNGVMYVFKETAFFQCE